VVAAEPLMIPPGDDAASLNDYSAYHGVRADLPQPAAGKLESLEHVLFI
jgi:hypothetical protein